MAKQILNGRFALKHDVEANWQKATGFIPMEGEAIVYQPDDTHDHPRFKVGDGATGVNELAFAAGSAGRDWSQNDPSAADYIKNRTHYGTIILPETELIAMDVTPGEGGAYLLDKPLAADIVEGATYEIVWGGEKYTSKAADASAFTQSDAPVFFFGVSPDPDIPAPGPDCPFMIMIIPDGLAEDGKTLYGQMDSLVTPDPPTLSIVDSDFKKLDPMFMPETVVMAKRPDLGGGRAVLEEAELIETDNTVGENNARAYYLPTAVSGLVDGETYKIIWGGIEYTSKAKDVTTFFETPFTAFALGSGTAVGGSLPFDDPGPDCPFMIQIADGGYDNGSEPYYGEVYSVVRPDPPILSILEASNSAPKQLTMNPNGKIVWEDRTHYEAISSGAIWSESEPFLLNADDEMGLSMFISAQKVVNYPIADAEYTVVHNGVTSTTKCLHMVDVDEAYFILGNMALMEGSGDTGEKYIIMIPDPAVMSAEDMDGITAMMYDITNMGTGEAAPTTATFEVEGPCVTIKKIDEKYLPDRAFEKTPQSDWQAGVSDNGHVLNRTHWIDPAGTVVVDHEYSISAGRAGFSTFSRNEDEPYWIIAPGATYTVMWEDTEYTCVAKRSQGTKDYGVWYPYYVGNGSKYHGSEDTGEPFAIATNADGSMWMYVSYSNTPAITHYSVTVAGDGAYHQLDDRFVNFPETVVSDWDAVEGEAGHILNRTHWVETDVPNLLEDATFTVYDSSGNSLFKNLYVSSTPLTSLPKVGCTYTVIVDNVPYDCEAILKEYSDTSLFHSSGDIVLGVYESSDGINNTRHNTHMPFSLAIPDPSEVTADYPYYAKLIIESDADSHTVSIRGGDIVRKIDRKYLPDSPLLLAGSGLHSMRGLGAKEEQIKTSIGSEGKYTLGDYAIALGREGNAKGNYSFAVNGSASGSESVAFSGAATGLRSAAFSGGIASGDYSFAAPGINSRASGSYSYSQGFESESSGGYSRAHGFKCVASGSFSQSVGSGIVAAGEHSYAGGYVNQQGAVYITGDANALTYSCNGVSKLSVGGLVSLDIDFSNCAIITNMSDTTITVDRTLSSSDVSSQLLHYAVAGAFGDYSYSNGYSTKAVGNYSHAEGEGVDVKCRSGAAYGQYNLDEDVPNATERGTYALAFGNGKSFQQRSNAFAIDWNGNAYYAGNVYVQGNGKTFGFDGKKKLATEEYVDNAMSEFSGKLILTDTVTGINYELYVENGTLSMKEIE